jgi:hypothetical protein
MKDIIIKVIQYVFKTKNQIIIMIFLLEKIINLNTKKLILSLNILIININFNNLII